MSINQQLNTRTNSVSQYRTAHITMATNTMVICYNNMLTADA